MTESSQHSLLYRWLDRNRGFFFAAFAMIASFSTYACMYAFRKPFTAASYSGLTLFGADFKTVIVIAQVFGYMISKFLGIKIVSEMLPHRRPAAIIGFVLFGELSLLGFALIPYPWNAVCMFLNGLPLGMIWGLVFSYLEGRRLTEVLGAGLSASFIVSSGVVKSVAKYLMTDWHVPEMSMPAVTGALFFIPLLVFVWLLSQLPPPTPEDEQLRTPRVPMNGSERKEFFLKFAGGISILTLVYMALTAYRDLRDNFAADVWTELGFGNQPLIFTSTEIPVAVVVLILVGSLMAITDNRKALLANHWIIALGFILVGLSTIGFASGIIGGAAWMIIAGIGLYMGYVPFNCILFDRLIATHRQQANAGFLIYIADSFGYLASVGTLLVKNLFVVKVSWVNFFIQSGYVLSLGGLILTMGSAFYFARKLPQTASFAATSTGPAGS